MKQYQRNGAKFCLNLKPEYVSLLKQLARTLGSYDRAILYLIIKYRYRLARFKKKINRSTKIYQPTEKEYKRFSFRLRREVVWGALNRMKEITGFSNSLLIRIMLEWEFYANGIQRVKETVQSCGGEYPEEMDNIGFWVWERRMRRRMRGIILQRIGVYTRIHLIQNSFHIQHRFYYT